MTDYIFVHLYNDYSGSPRVLKLLASVISNRKDTRSINIVTSEGEGVLNDVAFDRACFFRYKPRKNNIIKVFHYLYAQVKIFLLVLLLLLKSRSSNRVLVINTMLPFGAAIAGILFPSVKVVYYLHESYIKPNILKRFLIRCISISSDKNIFVSTYLKDELKINNVSGDVIYNSVDVSMIERFDISSKENNVIFLSSLIKYKGVDRFIDLARLSIDEKKYDLKFTLILNASKKDFIDYVDALKIDLPRNLSVYFRPGNIKSFYARAKFVINLTDHESCVETFGLTLAEGMCNGVIPIAPNYGGPREVIGSGTGYLFDVFNSEDILNYIMSFNDSYNYKTIEELLEQSEKFQINNYSSKINLLFDGIVK